MRWFFTVALLCIAAAALADRMLSRALSTVDSIHFYRNPDGGVTEEGFLTVRGDDGGVAYYSREYRRQLTGAARTAVLNEMSAAGSLLADQEGL